MTTVPTIADMMDVNLTAISIAAIVVGTMASIIVPYVIATTARRRA